MTILLTDECSAPNRTSISTVTEGPGMMGAFPRRREKMEQKE